MIEPKLHGKEQHLYDSLIELYKRYDMYDLVSIQSLSLPSLMEIRKRDPRIQIGYIIFGGMGNFSAINVDFYSIQETIAQTRTINTIHATGKKVYIWTVNSQEYIDTYLRMGVDGIITDEVPLVREEIQGVLDRERIRPNFVIQFLWYEINLPIFRLMW